jgi:uroporphyrin-III C-methyltransferase/precorrin-2 dehydrogenase/sirohydrochlorin ferrochelatase
VNAAKKGQRIVRLKCGDPSIFGRSDEELSALRAADIPVEIVPGVTAACGAAAAMGEPLTERGAIDTLTLTTGHLVDGETVPHALKTLHPGTCLTLYMAVSAADRITSYLLSNASTSEITVTVVANAQTKSEQILECDVRSLTATLAAAGITDTAMIILKWRKAQAVPKMRLA